MLQLEKDLQLLSGHTFEFGSLVGKQRYILTQIDSGRTQNEENPKPEVKRIVDHEGFLS